MTACVEIANGINLHEVHKRFKKLSLSANHYFCGTIKKLDKHIHQTREEAMGREAMAGPSME